MGCFLDVSPTNYACSKPYSPTAMLLGIDLNHLGIGISI